MDKEKLFVGIGLDPQKAKETLKNAKLSTNLARVIEKVYFFKTITILYYSFQFILLYFIYLLTHFIFIYLFRLKLKMELINQLVFYFIKLQQKLA